VSYKIVSADDHLDVVSLPPTLYTDRLPKKFLDRGPQVIQTPQGNVWMADGEKVGDSGASMGTEPALRAIDRAGIEHDGFRPSTPELRLEDMDRDGIYAHVIYGPATGMRISDPLLKAACLSAYNAWSAEFNDFDYNRLCILAHLPPHEPQAAVDELRTAAQQRHRGAVISPFDAAVPIYDVAWEPLWTTAEETEVVMHFHLGKGMWLAHPLRGSWRLAAFSTVAPIQLDEALAVMIFSGALERHPNMKLVLGESGLGWIPYVIERMDLQMGNHGARATDYRIQMKPSELFHRQVYATFEEENLGKRLIPEIGIDNVMWASDYPHPDSTFPESKRAIKELSADMNAAAVKKLTSSTAASLYKISV